MSKKIFIDATRPNHNAIVILNQSGELEEFVSESPDRLSVKSNIYLGKVVRVEHSLQAAFVEYTNGKTGFLPFSEIHPNYYQIPKFDREEVETKLREEERRNASIDDNIHTKDGDDDSEDESNYSYSIYKKYNIQEVIKRGQNLLVQVFRDERGNKGASLTTYISLPGRYCVLMPNSPRGIGISKKIEAYEERKRLVNIVKRINIPDGIGFVVRTAGLHASDKDIRRDYDYLVDLWNEIRNNAVKSKICDIVYEERGVIEQTIRDYYDPINVSSVIVAGSGRYQEISSFVKKLMPGEEKKIVQHNDRVPIFRKYGVNNKLKELLNEKVKLKSGGYLVINHTEALTAIDINSGKAINEKNIEDTALKINLEATDEIARQVMLRNIGGLIVIDYIDMDELKNRKAVESRLKYAFATDKAKIQFTKISIFGLVEVSRQRLHSSLMETLTTQCSVCHGTGRVMSNNVIATDILDCLVEQSQNNIKKKPILELLCNKDIAEFLVMSHINEIKDIEADFNLKIAITQAVFKSNEEFIIRGIESNDNLETAEQLYHSVAAKIEAIAINEQNVGWIKKMLAKLSRKKD